MMKLPNCVKLNVTLSLEQAVFLSAVAGSFSARLLGVLYDNLVEQLPSKVVDSLEFLEIFSDNIDRLEYENKVLASLNKSKVKVGDNYYFEEDLLKLIKEREERNEENY